MYSICIYFNICLDVFLNLNFSYVLGCEFKVKTKEKKPKKLIVIVKRALCVYVLYKWYIIFMYLCMYVCMYIYVIVKVVLLFNVYHFKFE